MDELVRKSIRELSSLFPKEYTVEELKDRLAKIHDLCDDREIVFGGSPLLGNWWEYDMSFLNGVEYEIKKRQ